SGRVYVLSGAQTNLISNTNRFKPDQFATAVVGLDDLNEDGRADYCGGAPLWEVDFLTRSSDNTGIVECYNGPPAAATGLASDEIIEFEGPLETLGTPPLEKGQVFGSAVAAIRNNEDGGLTDVIVGAPLRDVFKMVDGMLVKLQNAGEAFRLSALDGSVIAEYKGVEVANRFGAAVANAGDVNGDGLEDVIVGAPDSNTVAGVKAGRAYVFSGATHLLLNQYEGENAQDAFGSAVASAGDVNGDGRDDLLVGAPQVDGPAGTNAGRVYVFAGGSAAVTPILVIDGPQRNEFFGAALARLADLDGNGFDDYAVGSPSFDAEGGSDAGKVTVFDGAFGAELFTLVGSAKQDFFGSALSAARDVDGDGLPELIVGAPGVANIVGWKTGKVLVYSNEPAEGGGLAPKLLLDYAGQANGDAFGASVAGGGDMDGDGVPDIVVGAYLNVGTAGASTGQYGRAYAFNVVCRDQDADGYGSPPTPLCD
ncbi:MAG: integrin alpha, partial [Candidatus Methylomirabilis sp.]|nr:integrin alpha [Deltaproteobacteria bacterium]